MKIKGEGIIGIFVLSGIALIVGIMIEVYGINPIGFYQFSVALFVIASYLALSKSGKLGSFGIVR